VYKSVLLIQYTCYRFRPHMWTSSWMSVTNVRCIEILQVCEPMCRSKIL